MTFITNCVILLLWVSVTLAQLNTLEAVRKLTSPIVNQVDNVLSFVDTAAKHGYKAEEYEVTTEDGYILAVHRILAENNCTTKRPVLLMHGLLQSSEGFIDVGPEAPAYMFTNECYDVWLGNARGNLNSRKHTTLNPDKDLKFWKFSVDEMGKYDVPATIDFVLNQTNSEKLIYLGFSQGGGTFFIMNSEKPEYAEKVSLFVGLAPATRHLNSKSLLFNALTLINTVETELEALGIWEVLTKGFPVSALVRVLCALPTGVGCDLITSLVDSSNPDSTTLTNERSIYDHAPAGTSTQNAARYGQALIDEHFSKFDYGVNENLRVYGSTKPPQYDLSRVQMPTVVFHGDADQIVDSKDIAWAVNQLPSVLEFIKVKDPKWNHLDMTYSRYFRETIFSPTLKYLKIYDGTN